MWTGQQTCIYEGEEELKEVSSDYHKTVPNDGDNEELCPRKPKTSYTKPIPFPPILKNNQMATSEKCSEQARTTAQAL